MADDFDEVNKPADKSLADIKGEFRYRVVQMGNDWAEIAVATGLSIQTVRKVMLEDNIRHTYRTIMAMAAYCDIRIAFVDGLKSRRQPNELPPLAPGKRAWMSEKVKEMRSKRRS